MVKAGNPFERKHADIYVEYQARLLKAGAMDFDDLLMKVVELFRDHPDVLAKYQRRFQHILVDEYQDTNMAQNEIALMLASDHRQITIVGDGDQSVYGWRGADIRNITQFEDTFEDVTTIVLDQNYSQHAGDPRCGQRGHRQQPGSQGEAPLERARCRRADRALPRRGRGR